MVSDFFLSVFTPSYNRADLLPRLYESLCVQSFYDFEWIIIDDGSEDGTEDLVERLIQKSPFQIVYRRQPNGGKHRARNAAVELARGDLFTSIDSDDYFIESAFSIISDVWASITESGKNELAGFMALSLKPDGSLIGDKYPRHGMKLSYIEQRSKYKVRGDKQIVYRTEVAKQYRYPEFDGENYMHPSVVHMKVSQKYQFLGVNEATQVKDYQVDGLTGTRSSSKGRARKIKNCNGMRYSCLLSANLRAKETLRDLWKGHRDYVRYALHSGEQVESQRKSVTNRTMWLVALPFGWMQFRSDLAFIEKHPELF